MVKVVDCRICGDPNSVLRFAFIEFTDEGNLRLTPLSVHVLKGIFVLIVNVRNLGPFDWLHCWCLVMQKVQGLLWVWQGQCLDFTLLGCCPLRQLLHQLTRRSCQGYRVFLSWSLHFWELWNVLILWWLIVFIYFQIDSNFYLQNEDEREMCARTIYCTNIDKKVIFLNTV